MSRAFLSCDWGTSSFRIRWVENDCVVHEFRDATGCKAIYDQADGNARGERYEKFLRGVLESWTLKLPVDPIPLVISGMASSSIGWMEIPYGAIPLKLDGSNLRFETMAWNSPRWVANTYIISGVATKREIMRGEETEAVGIGAEEEICLLVLPGTHSKHLLIHHGEVRDFWTYMTGELFDVLAHHSILRATTDLTSLEVLKLDAFDEGVREAKRSSLASALFQTRTRAILKAAPSAENTWFLSGLLIGAELRDLTERCTGDKILIAGASRIRRLYARAMGAFDTNWQELSDQVLENAVPRAHARFLQQRGEWTR
jgi:2-dehydro-3-deoxygalactonokinase